MSVVEVLGQNIQRKVVNAYLVDPQTGAMNYNRATPAALQPLVLMTMVWSAHARKFVSEAIDNGGYWYVDALAAGVAPVWRAIDPSGLVAARSVIMADLDALDVRLEHYAAKVNECIATGKAADPACTYDQVVNPLILGWFGVNWRDGGDAIGCIGQLNPCVQRLADVSVPGVVVGTAAEMGKIDRESFLEGFGHSLSQSGEDVAKSLGSAIAESIKIVPEVPASMKLAMGFALIAGVAAFGYAVGK
jgi:hypothetical protein